MGKILSAQETGWIIVRIGGNESYYAKPNTVKIMADGIKIWTKTVYAVYKLKSITYENVTIKTLNIFNCERRQAKILQSITLNSLGKVLETEIEDEKQAQWFDVVPDSVGEMFLNITCRSFNKK